MSLSLRMLMIVRKY